MIRWLRKQQPRVDPDELAMKAERSLNATEAKQEHVDKLTGWLDKRKNQNGFGEDFEYTLKPRRAQ